MNTNNSVRRLRRELEEHGLMLVKSLRRDARAEDCGLYVVVDASAGNRVGRYGGQAAASAFAQGDGMSLAGVGELVARLDASPSRLR